jgi:hypothetical protein
MYDASNARKLAYQTIYRTLIPVYKNLSDKPEHPMLPVVDEKLPPKGELQ